MSKKTLVVAIVVVGVGEMFLRVSFTEVGLSAAVVALLSSLLNTY